MRSSPPHSRRSSKPRRTVSIIGTGSYVPERVLTNRELEQMVETSDEWIRTRTGISERRIATTDEATSDMGTRAALAAMQQAKVRPDEIDLIVVATVTPDMFFPATACRVQHCLGASNAWGFDLSGACSGFLYALTVGAQFVGAGTHRKALVIGGDVMTSILNYEDRNTCVLFGDGAGAVLVEPAESDNEGII